MTWWGWILVAWPVSIPFATTIAGYFDEFHHQNTGESATEDPILYLVGALWPIGVFLMLPELGRGIYRWRKARREQREQRKIEVEARAKVMREDRIRDAPFRQILRRRLELGK